MNLRKTALSLVMAVSLASISLASQAQIFKANNNTSLDQGGSWTGGTAPGSTTVGGWDHTVSTAANCTNSLAANVTWQGIKILDPGAPVLITTNATPKTISIGSSGIDLGSAAVNLWVAPAITTVADQTWTVANGRTLTVGEAGKTLTVANNVIINGAIAFPNTINVSGGSLTIPSGTTLTSTIVNAATSITVGGASVGAITQTGGAVIVGYNGTSSSNPKTSMVLGGANAGTYSITGGSLTDGSTSSGGRFDVGTSGAGLGTLNISGTASVQCQALYVANGGNGTVNVTNGTLTVSGPNVRVGVSAGTGTMNVYGGIVQSATTMNLPNGAGTGILNVNGGAVNLSGLNVANTGPGTATVNGGVLTVATSIALAPSTGSGTVNLNGGITIASSITYAGSGPATLNWNGGTLKPQSSSASFVGANVTANVGVGGAIIDTTNFNITIRPPLLNGTGGGADGGLTKSGAGILTLAGTNTYNGPTIVNAGTLLANSPGSIAASTNIVVAAGATLNVSGSGTIAVHTAPTLAGTLVMQISKNGTTPGSDKLTFAGGTINCGGVLTVTTTGNLPVAGDTFDLFSATSFTGGFTTINLPTLANGLNWDASRLAVDGSIKVITNNAAPPIPLSFSSIVLRSGTNVVFGGSGGTSNGAYFVLSSTNVALPLTNWTMIGGSNWFDANGNFNFTNVVNRTLPAQFFALSLSPLALSAADSIILQALQNMRDEGFNSCLPAPGGLYINWRYTNSPPVSSNNVNINYDGTPDPDPATRHDRLTDIDYLACLALFKHAHPLDTQFDAEINRYTTICQSAAHDNFLASPDQRGWVYWVLEDIISEVPSFAGYDNAQADKYYNLYTNHLSKYGQTMPLYYGTPADELNSTYRVDLLIEDACVLIVNGKARNLTNYATAGENLIVYAQSNAYSSTLKMWTDTMGHLFTDTNRTTLSPSGQQYIYDATVNVSEIGEITEALCRAEAADPGKGYGALARATLDKLVPATNSFGLWDAVHGGYYSNLILNGTNIQSAGLTASVNTTYKQIGRAAVMIQAFLAANNYAGASYDTNTLNAVNTANLSSYYTDGHGWPFQENNDYSIYLDHVTTPTNYYVPQNWVTSEAISHAVRALLKYQLAVPK